MKNRNNRDDLLDELLGDDLRTASLEHLLSAARRARKIRRLRLGGAICALIFAAAASVIYRPVDPPAVASLPMPEPAIRIISDDELLALFPGRAVALVGPPNRQQLVFLDAAH